MVRSTIYVKIKIKPNENGFLISIAHDWIKFKDGTKLPFQHVYEIMSPIEGIVKFKVIQETYDLLKIKVVKYFYFRLSSY